MQELEDALKNFRFTNRSKGSSMDKLVREIPDTNNDLSNYVANLTPEQLAGRIPVISILDNPNQMTRVRLDLYWCPSTKELDFDWDDANPHKTPYRKLK